MSRYLLYIQYMQNMHKKTVVFGWFNPLVFLHSIAH